MRTHFRDLNSGVLSEIKQRELMTDRGGSFNNSNVGE